MAATNTPNLGSEVEVLGFDGEPKYVGIYAGTDDNDPTRACVWIPDAGEFSNPPHDHVQEKGASL